MIKISQESINNNDQELRCKQCGKLLGKGLDHGHFEIKCLRCGTLNYFFEEISEQVIITDPAGVILYANQAVQNVSGYSISEVIGQKPSLWGGQMPPEFYRSLWKTISEEKKSIQVSLTNKNKSGQTYQVDLKISPILDTEGNIRFYVGIEKLI